jgi:molybdopterin molybdotransferase
MTRAAGMRTVEQHLAEILDRVPSLPAETVAIEDAEGRILVEDTRARFDVPAFDNSAMDGFAVRFADVAAATADSPVAVRVVADLPAGTALDPALGAGEAARIMTGSPVPADADTIVPFESTAGGLADSLGEAVVLRAPSEAGQHVRRRGADARTGDVVLGAGIRVGAFALSTLASTGIAEVAVARRPRVAVVSTGTELAGPGEPLERGMIPESNSLVLAALAREAGAEVVLRTRVADEADALRAVVARAVAGGADAIVFSGGVSAGAYEVVKSTLGPGGEMAFSSVAMQPGKPQGFGALPGGALLFGLPGNPVSSALSFEAFVRPALLRMQGAAAIARPVLRLPAATAWRTPPIRRQYLPAAIDRTDPARWTVRPATAGGSGSHLASGLGRAEAYAVVPAEVDAVAPGDLVDVMLVT